MWFVLIFLLWPRKVGQPINDHRSNSYYLIEYDACCSSVASSLGPELEPEHVRRKKPLLVHIQWLLCGNLLSSLRSVKGHPVLMQHWLHTLALPVLTILERAHRWFYRLIRRHHTTRHGPYYECRECSLYFASTSRLCAGAFGRWAR